MALICSYCEGDGYNHRCKCNYNETFDDKDCTCDKPKCQHCSRKNLERKQNIKKEK